MPIVTHVHGAADVGDESDGYSEAWYLPAAGDIQTGTPPRAPGTTSFWQGRGEIRRDVGCGFATFHYPNRGRGVDELVPRPRPRDDPAQRLRRSSRFLHHPGRTRRRRGCARHPHQSEGNAARTGAARTKPFPSNTPYREIPIAIQDRAFKADGSLFYPDTGRSSTASKGRTSPAATSRRSGTPSSSATR